MCHVFRNSLLSLEQQFIGKLYTEALKKRPSVTFIFSNVHLYFVESRALTLYKERLSSSVMSHDTVPREILGKSFLGLNLEPSILFLI